MNDDFDEWTALQVWLIFAEPELRQALQRITESVAFSFADSGDMPSHDFGLWLAKVRATLAEGKP
jgi:hypothetical protein